MLYQLCVKNTDFSGVRYHSTKLTNCNGNRKQNFMINYALPAQDIKRSGYCPALAGKLSLTEPITPAMYSDLQISSLAGYFSANGLPILSTRGDKLQKDDTALALDKLTMYFDKILLDRNFDALRPLNGWK